MHLSPVATLIFDRAHVLLTVGYRINNFDIRRNVDLLIHRVDL